MSMKIKKVDNKPMVIHTKKKMNIHKAESIKDMKNGVQLHVLQCLYPVVSIFLRII